METAANGALFSPSSSVHRKGKTHSVAREQILGDGQFDRYAAARRTRRYGKKPQHDDEHSAAAVAYAATTSGENELKAITATAATTPQKSNDERGLPSATSENGKRGDYDRPKFESAAGTDALATTNSAGATTNVIVADHSGGSNSGQCSDIGDVVATSAGGDGVSSTSPNGREKDATATARNRIPVLRSNYIRSNSQRLSWASSTLPRSYKTHTGLGNAVTRSPTETDGYDGEDQRIGKDRRTSAEAARATNTAIARKSSNATAASAPLVVFDESGDATGISRTTDTTKRPRKMISLLPKRINGVSTTTTTTVGSPPQGYGHTLPRSATSKGGSGYDGDSTNRGKGSSPSLTNNRGSVEAADKRAKSNPKLESYTKVIRSLASNLHKSTNKMTPKRPATTTLTSKSKNAARDDSLVVSRSSSSSSSSSASSGGGVGNGHSYYQQQRRPFPSNLRSLNQYKEGSTDAANQAKFVANSTSSQNFMKPTASSTAKDQTEVKPKIIVRTPFK